MNLYPDDRHEFRYEYLSTKFVLGCRPANMSLRPSSRLLVLDNVRRLLLFRFQYRDGVLAGQSFWATPGGGLEDGETFEQAARRELYEEIGVSVDHLGPEVAQRTAVFALPTGEMVEADERYFAVLAENVEISDAGWTDLERSAIAEHRWWCQRDLATTIEQVWPENLTQMLIDADLWPAMF